jgi:cobalt transporter subunit CbtA
MPLTTHATRPGSLVTEAVVNQFRKLMVAVFGSGALAGLVLFAVLYFTVVPLIHAAEAYEAAAREAHSGAPLEDEGWQPAEGWERTCFTALTTVLTGIGFAAMLFGVMALAGTTINTRHGALWGLAAFASFSLAPALGLPPEPPGVAVADLHQRQLWWAGTVIATAVGVWLVAGQRRSWLLRVCGVVWLLLPHVIGAPVAVGGNNVPAELVRRFTIASVATSGIFWLLVGALGGLIYSCSQADA